MSKYTVDEKLQYNMKRKGEFSSGYVFGVKLYRDYAGADENYRKTIKGLINTASSAAVKGEETSRGIMCGVRDAANERKAKMKKRN